MAALRARCLGCRSAHRLHVPADTEGRVLPPHDHGRFARGDKVIVPARGQVKVPDDVWLIEEEVRPQVGAAIQRFLGEFSPDLEVHSVSSPQPLLALLFV